MKLWIDDIRPAPDGYLHIKTVNDAVSCINEFKDIIEVIDLDHDAGDYYSYGGDYIRILDYLEFEGISIPIHIHSQNPVGIQNMKRIIEKNGWKYV